MSDKYSKFGPASRTPSCMHRSYLLSIDFKVSSLTDCAVQLKINSLYTILSGFVPGNTPGVGTFLWFFDRLWDSENDNLSPHIHSLKEKVKKTKAKSAKAEPVVKIPVAGLLPLLENTLFHLKKQPYQSLFLICKKQFLDVSVSKGLIKKGYLSLAGDGTSVVTSHRIRSYRICDYTHKGIPDCNCDRYFSQPNCDIGWDSCRDCWYHGYHLYMLAASDSESDLLVFSFLNPASKHDFHGFLETFSGWNLLFRISMLQNGSWILPMMQCLSMNTVNGKALYFSLIYTKNRGTKVKYKNDFTIGKDGVQACKESRRMNHDGYEKSKRRLKFRCPLTSRKYGCSCEHPCSDPKYVRTVHLAMKDNPKAD